MQAVVTSVGGYGGAPAFEYEVRDDPSPGSGQAAAALLAVDFVVVHPLPGETWDDLAALAESFLRRRAAKWALSETAAQRARRRESRTGGRRLAELGSPELPLVGGAPPQATHLVAVALTTAEALALQRIEADIEEREEQPDGTLKPTGRMIHSVTEAFRV